MTWKEYGLRFKSQIIWPRFDLRKYLKQRLFHYETITMKERHSRRILFD